MAHGERAANLSNWRKEYWKARPGNKHGPNKGPCDGMSKKTITHRIERARAKAELQREVRGVPGAGRSRATSDRQ